MEIRRLILSRYCTLLIALASACLASAQKSYSWERLPGLYPDTNNRRIDIIKTIGKDLYALKLYSDMKKSCIWYWKGSAWTATARINYEVISLGTRPVVLNNVIYVSGLMSRKNGAGSYFHGLSRYNGSSWDSIASSRSWVQFDAETWQNKIYALEMGFSSIDTQKLVFYDALGNRSVILDKPKATILSSYGNRLIMSGINLDSVRGKATSKIAFYDGTDFIAYSSKKIDNITNICVINDSQFVTPCVISGNTRIMLWQHDSIIKDITSNYFSFTASVSSLMQKDSILLSLDNKVVIYYNMNTGLWYSKDRFNSSFQSPVFKGTADASYLIGSGFIEDGAFTLSDKIMGSLKGKLYRDNDYSCSFTAGDEVLKYTRFVLLNNSSAASFSFYTDGNGFMNCTELPMGTYTIVPALPYTSVWPCTDTFGFSSSLPDVKKNIGLKPARNVSDFAVSISGHRGFNARQGFDESYSIACTRVGAMDDSAMLRIIYPPDFTYLSASASLYSHKGDTLLFRLDTMGWGETRVIKMSFNVPVMRPVGDTAKFMTLISATGPESDYRNNADTLSQKIVSAYDPNDKQSFPSGAIKPGLEKIKYFIQFQNLGTDTAFRVTVVDTINVKMPIQSVKVTGSSHYNRNYSLRVENNALVWRFDDIKLPPQKTDDERSRGWITFEMAVRPDVKVGDTIDNKAYIYFDYQKAIKTNTALAFLEKNDNLPDIVSGPGRTIRLYPNPNTGRFNVTYSGANPESTLVLFDMKGRSLASFYVQKNQEQLLDISGFTPGVYLLKDLYSGSFIKFSLE